MALQLFHRGGFLDDHSNPWPVRYGTASPVQPRWSSRLG